jgi:hypothetical protein
MNANLFIDSRTRTDNINLGELSFGNFKQLFQLYPVCNICLLKDGSGRSRTAVEFVDYGLGFRTKAEICYHHITAVFKEQICECEVDA